MPRTAPCSICKQPMSLGRSSAPAGTGAHRACRQRSHGLRGYKRGCRCQTCRSAKSADMAVYLARRAEQGRPVRPSAEVRERSRAKEKANYSYTEEKRQRDAVRRARKAGAAVERFLNVEVFERDGWLCGICGVQVDRDAAYPDPLMPSLDHVVPLSLGGAHSMANTRCTHLGCNVKRGNRLEEGGGLDGAKAAGRRS